MEGRPCRPYGVEEEVTSYGLPALHAVLNRNIHVLSPFVVMMPSQDFYGKAATVDGVVTATYGAGELMRLQGGDATPCFGRASLLHIHLAGKAGLGDRSQAICPGARGGGGIVINPAKWCGFGPMRRRGVC